ncbi:MAG: 4-hydroxythreonine-4-phosphate dehydrogenase PdxA [Planctomycetes bacterium RIFCSPHIGHO2_12_39_6]|nr:MAG: 4-hydroxythreonine-4-phosphate dehydrogenase PdxA [Planctomycetes bacterium RIFCSPHIGHO2_12_39_6]
MKKTKKSKLLIGVTMGDPCGIGPEIILKAIKSPAIRKIASYVIIGNKGVFDKTARALNIPMEYSTISHISDIGGLKTSVFLLPTGEFKSGLMKLKRATAEGGELSVQCVIRGINLAMSGHIDALVTAPICKEAIHLAGYGYPGHTEMLRIFSGAGRVVMLMVGGKLRVAFVTTHIALKDVPQSITIEDVLETIVITDSGLRQYFGLKKPRFAVCGLNPHAGEQGYLGTEEKNTMIPVLEKFRQQGHLITGPIGADVAFTDHYRNSADVILAMYHDQGLPMIKYTGFHEAINVTLGLPFVRTSVDHGTALDIAGKALADTTSLHRALLFAAKMRAHEITPAA